MLGLTKSNPLWVWAAYGKHPAIRDYFRVGDDFPWLKIFSSWVDEGYKTLAGKNSAQTLHSWSFWARGASRDSIVCGLVKDSRDGFGRNYPLLMLGAGALREWDESWDLLPLACETTWSDMDRVSGGSYADVRELEKELKTIRSPLSVWREHQLRLDAFRAGNDTLKTAPDLTADGKEHCIRLDQASPPGRPLMASHWHSLLKARSKAAPNVVFLGESFGVFFLKFYKRPLTSADFLQLWKAGAEG